MLALDSDEVGQLADVSIKAGIQTDAINVQKVVRITPFQHL